MRKITAKQLAHFYMGMSILTAGIITLTNQIELGFIFGPSSRDPVKVCVIDTI